MSSYTPTTCPQSGCGQQGTFLSNYGTGNEALYMCPNNHQWTAKKK